MNLLMIYPEYPDSFWGFRYALGFIAKKAAQPPLGLLTIAGMLPEDWKIKLVDLNVEKLKNKHIEWADIVFVSAMSIQKWSSKKVIARCKEKGKRVVVGGPLFSTEPECFPEADHIFINESELVIREFLRDLAAGTPKRIYECDEHPDISTMPTPRWELIRMRRYASMNMQYSRGCPFACEFCAISSLFGRKVRTKSSQTFERELESLYQTGWRGNVFLVDDNFIGNRGKLRSDILPMMRDWMKRRKRPFAFSTEVSIDLADDEELTQLMLDAGFDAVFVGIETPDEEALKECNKVQNQGRDMLDSIHKLQKAGFNVTGGFILGFDTDKPSVFDRLVSFISEAGIGSAMVGLLNAPKKTKLYERLKGENRLIEDGNWIGNNTEFKLNFTTKMEENRLIEGYRSTLGILYSPRQYYSRIMDFMRRHKMTSKSYSKVSLRKLIALLKSMFRLGVIGSERRFYWKLLFWTIFTRPRQFPLAVSLAIYGFHFRKYFRV